MARNNAYIMHVQEHEDNNQSRNFIGGEPAAVRLEDSARTKSSLYSFEKRSRNIRRVPHSNQESRTKSVSQSGSPLKQDDELRPAVNSIRDFTERKVKTANLT